MGEVYKARDTRLDRTVAMAMIAVPGGSVRAAAVAWGVSKSTAARWIGGDRAPATRVRSSP